MALMAQIGGTHHVVNLGQIDFKVRDPGAIRILEDFQSWEAQLLTCCIERLVREQVGELVEEIDFSQIVERSLVMLAGARVNREREEELAIQRSLQETRREIAEKAAEEAEAA